LNLLYHAIVFTESAACWERDKMILAFAIAMNEGNNASSELEEATTEEEREEATCMVLSAKMHGFRLRLAVLDHCREHGC
jgi:hypothetical protein